MCRLIETIKVENGKLQNMQFHAERFARSRELLFHLPSEHLLENCIKIPDEARKGIFKCRVIYSDRIHSVEFIPYLPRIIHSLQLVYDEDIDYSFKFEDRSRIETLKHKTGADEILIVKNGLITDTSFSNIVFFDGRRYLTPSIPLLRGTRRARLLSEGRIEEAHLRPDDILNFSHAFLINAMTGLEEGLPILPGNIK
jgi:4-amino-4-deoxychorismate lyase